MTLYEAIFNRKSVRHYDLKPLPEQSLKRLADYVKNLNQMNEDISYKVDIIELEKAQKHFFGIFRVKAPYYLLLTIEDKEGALLEAGYLAEQMVLYLAGKGLGTCYQGATKINKSYISKGYKAAMVIAFGYAQRRVYRDVSQANRYPLNKICLFKETPDEDIRTLLKAARLAPSAMNKQPWRFIVYKDEIHIYSKRDTGLLLHRFVAEFDIGVMICHILVAADELWIEVERKQDIVALDRNMEKLKYCISVKKILA